MYRCDRNEIQNREINRGNRVIGTSLNLLDKFETKDMHDIIIDGTHNTPSQLAVEILERINLGILLQS